MFRGSCFSLILVLAVVGIAAANTVSFEVPISQAAGTWAVMYASITCQSGWGATLTSYEGSSIYMDCPSSGELGMYMSAQVQDVSGVTKLVGEVTGLSGSTVALVDSGAFAKPGTGSADPGPVIPVTDSSAFNLFFTMVSVVGALTLTVSAVVKTLSRS